MKKELKIRIYILVLMIIFITSLLSALLLVFYMDPVNDTKIAIILMLIALFLFISSFTSILIYFFKKIYYRWEIFISNLNSSLRQWIFLAIFIIWNWFFYNIWVMDLRTVSLFLTVIIFIELIVQAITNN